jgi:hypothetical protein
MLPIEEEEAITLENLSIRIFKKDGRSHRTFNYHISRPLPKKPKRVVEKVASSRFREKRPSKRAEQCIVVQQSSTCACFNDSDDVVLKPLKQLSITSIKITTFSILYSSLFI